MSRRTSSSLLFPQVVISAGTQFRPLQPVSIALYAMMGTTTSVLRATLNLFHQVASAVKMATKVGGGVCKATAWSFSALKTALLASGESLCGTLSVAMRSMKRTIKRQMEAAKESRSGGGKKRTPFAHYPCRRSTHPPPTHLKPSHPLAVQASEERRCGRITRKKAYKMN